MPTVLEWNFEGGDDGSELAARRGKQRVFFGDTVVDEVLGQGKALRLACAIMTIEFSEGSEKVERIRTNGHVYALASREAREPRAPTNKAPADQHCLAVFFKLGEV